MVFNNVTITEQPISQTKYNTDNVTFTVTAISAEPLSYQWYIEDILIDQTINSTAITNTLTITNLTGSNAGKYYVVILNKFGSVTSDIVTLDIKYKMIQPKPDFDIRLKMIHDECYHLIDYYVIDLLTERSEKKYNKLKHIVLDYLDNITNFNTPITKSLKEQGKQVNSLRILIKDMNQNFVIDTFTNASNTYDDFINNTIFSKKYTAINDLQRIETYKSFIYDGLGGITYSTILQADINFYTGTHTLNYDPLYELIITCLTKENTRVVNDIVKTIPDIYCKIDTRLKSIHDEFNNEISDLINIFTEDRTEINYNNLRDSVFSYLDKIKKCETPITKELQLLGKQINSPRIVISDCNYSFILDTHETVFNTFNNFLTNTIHKSSPIHRLYLENVYALLYGYYGCTKFSYLIQQHVNCYVQTHGTNLTQPNYYLDIGCLSDENDMINENLTKLELVKDIPDKNVRLKMLYDEFILQVNYLLDIFINDKIDINYDNLKIKVFEYIEKIKNCSTPISSILQKSNKQINSPRIVIYDNNYYVVLDTFDTAYNTFYHYSNNIIHKNDYPCHVILPNDIRCAFYGSHSGTKISYFIHKNVNFYFQSYGPKLSEPLYYIGISCLADENVI